MRCFPEALTVFMETVNYGSFSAAARRLRKSQSTISTTTANLEAGLGVTLFDRATQQLTLTPQGEQVLSYVKAILAISKQLDKLTVPLIGKTKSRLTSVPSGTLRPDVLGNLLMQFDHRFPHAEFECLIGEDEDVVDLLQRVHTQVGLIEARDHYPTDIGGTHLPLQTAMGIYVAPDHPSAAQGKVVWNKLHGWYKLRSSTFLASTTEPAASQVWSAPNYLLLLNMTMQRFGQCILPCTSMTGFAPQGGLMVLDIPGWPRMISVDLLWNKKVPPGVAGNQLRECLQRREHQ